MEFLKVVRKLIPSLGSHPDASTPPPHDEERQAAEARRQEKRRLAAQELAATLKAAEETRSANQQQHQLRMERLQTLVDPPKKQPYRKPKP